MREVGQLRVAKSRPSSVSSLSSVVRPSCSAFSFSPLVTRLPAEASAEECHSPLATNSNHSRTIGNCCPTSRTRSNIYHYITCPCRRADNFAAARLRRTGPTQEGETQEKAPARRGERPLQKKEEPKNRSKDRPLQPRDGCAGAGRGFGAAGDIEKLLALHDEMRHATQGRGEPLRQAEGTIAFSHAATHDQASLARLRLFEDKGPSGLILTVGQAPGKNQAVFGLALRYDKDIFRTGKCGEHTAYTDVLQVGEDAFGTVVAAVINEVVGIPSGAARAHLRQPGPDITRRAANGDGVMDRADGLRNQIVSRKCADALGGSGADLDAGVSRQAPRRGETRREGQGVASFSSSWSDLDEANVVGTDVR